MGQAMDILGNLLASFIGYIFGRFWNKLTRCVQLKRGGAFFGLERGGRVRLLIGQYRSEPMAASQRDVGALIEAIGIIQPFDPEVIANPSNEIVEPVGDMTEFCIGGPDSNARTRVHLAEFLKGICAHSSQDEGQRLVITTKKHSFPYKRGKLEHAILAKIMAKPNAKPLFLICGQTSLANRGALYYLKYNYRHLYQGFNSRQFCLVVRLLSPTTYGHKMPELVEDVSDIAFS
jgi:hypothetical protein